MSNIMVDITPDKSLIKKLGSVGYRTEQAVAELIDNSIDARFGDTQTVDVTLDFRLGEIRVSDDGHGMDAAALGASLTVAKETAKGGLGRFGLGMKSACSSLGKAFTIRTSTPESDAIFTVRYDEDRWLGDESKKWTNFEVEKSDKTDDWYGTQITVSKIKVPLYPNQLLNFRRRFGIRYGPYIERGQVQVRVNSRTCRPTAPDLAGGKHPLAIDTAGGRIVGWVGILERRSIKGDYGIHLYRNGRLIGTFDKFGIRHHPAAARVVGELSLDHVPVNFHKTGFLIESVEYRDAVSRFAADPTVKAVMREASSPKASMYDLESMLVPDADSRLPPLDRVGAKLAKSMLQKAGAFTTRNGTVNFEFHDSDGIDVETVGNGVHVRIGRDSPAFRLFQNPLYLVDQIRIDAEMVADDPSLIHVIRRRNLMLNEFAKDRLRRAAGSGSRREAVHLPAYSLQDDLVDLHDCLGETFEHDFQFTGLSTLAPFLHNCHSKIIYTIHTAPGAGQSLLEAVSDHEKELVAVLNPRKRDMVTVLDVSERSRFLVVREYRGGLSPTWAGPEKAWLDLYFDVTRDRIPLYRDDLMLVLDELLDAGLARPSKVRSLARRRQILNEVEEYLPEE